MTRQEIFDRDGNRCVACGATEQLSVDHIIPLSRGGADSDGNKQTLCYPCNHRKGNAMPPAGLGEFAPPGEDHRRRRQRRTAVEARVLLSRPGPLLRLYLADRA